MSDIPPEVDLLVLGAGAGSMTAALTAAVLGLRMLPIEKTGLVGGTTARSAGSVWVPNSRHSPPGEDSFEKAFTYLRQAVGHRLDNVRREAGEWEEPTDVRVRDALLLRDVIDFARPLSIRRRQRCARTSALTSVPSRLGFRAGTATPSGVMISLRPPRRCSRMGMRMVRVSSSRVARPVITLRLQYGFGRGPNRRLEPSRTRRPGFAGLDRPAG